MTETRQSHWQRVYTDKEPTDVSWYQRVPSTSLRLISATGAARSGPVLDAGGGASTLVDQLLARGYTDISVLDVSGKALERSRARLGEQADAVHWIESDVTAFVPSRRYGVWHDRAVFHFLTDPGERSKYVDVLERALLPRGHLLLSTFGPEGPERCSGLPVQRYDIGTLQHLFADRLELRDHALEVHQTPSGSAQQFLYSWWQRRG
jgi:SAM-dependent methyltransferase